MAGLLLLIGVGNPLREDDGAGPLLAAALAAALAQEGIPTRTIVQQQLVPEMALDVAAPDVAAVCLCDVRVPEAEDDAGLRLHGPLDAAAPEPPGLTHEIGAGTLLAYAALLDDRPRPLWIATVAGRRFGHGEGLSPGVLAVLEEVAPLARTLAMAAAGVLGARP